MEFTIKEFDGSAKTIIPLAEAYMRSYNKLSEGYKSAQEMALYKKGSFIKKLKNYSKDKTSSVFVFLADEHPAGFVRYSNIPDYYKQPEKQLVQEQEHGEMDGFTFAWIRKVQFANNNPALNERTMIINQIYLDPLIQNQGAGTQIFKKTLPLMADKYDNFIVEYNANNARAKKFYRDVLGLEPIARTQDFDHIVLNERGRTDFCVSPVEIGMSSIANAMKHIKQVEQRQALNINIRNINLLQESKHAK